MFMDISALRLLKDMKIPQNFLTYNETNVKLPIAFAMEDSLIDLLIKNNLKGFIIEITPFREEEYQQITEKTPIKLFKEEMGLNEN